MRLTWLADKLRAAGLTVMEVDGWEGRGSDVFDPLGVTWHATAGNRKATAQGEVNVLVNGRPGLDGPISQLLVWRDGTVYVIASGRCNHNKVGWAGPNKGLGNVSLLGIEMANDNKGEPWPDIQLDAARRATAVIMTELKADPLKRLAAHYEHQPYDGRPPGETSTKSDPFGVVMTAERPRVREIMEEGFDMPLNKADAVTLFTSDDTIGAPTWHPDHARGNVKWAAATAIRVGLDETRRTYDAVIALGKVVTPMLTLLMSKDHVDEAKLVADLAPAVAAIVVPAVSLLLADLPSGAEVTPEALESAILGALRQLAPPVA